LIVVLKINYGPMRTHENNALNGDLYTVSNRVYENAEFSNDNPNGRASDLVVPVIMLIICCAAGMLYTGGFFSGTGFVEAFSGSDASVGLSTGSLFALIFTIIYYMIRRIVTFRESMDCVPEGFKAMVPAILILTFAWTLKAMTDSLGAAEYVAGLMEAGASSLMNFLPAIIFLVGCVLAFATGTSWGTFGILIPIVVSMFAGVDETMMIMSISACMAGAVCGDHCSPISDTTIMSSAGAQCDHISHVNTQLPYAVTVAAVSFVGYVITGLTKSIWLCLPVSIVMLAAVLVIIRRKYGKTS
ncbi:MAG: Na+/H+ antiporter NhaC family protein, partial [Bacillota bacterium]|nr:Na+/H+ antiporter NhaC family protein [Bacillota bacterium]